MRLHLRKQAQECIDFTRTTAEFSCTDFYEREILDAASEDVADVGLGRMTVLAAELLEQVRRADPAYGLPVAREVSPGVFQ
jgi:hypothetical protein